MGEEEGKGRREILGIFSVAVVCSNTALLTRGIGKVYKLGIRKRVN